MRLHATVQPGNHALPWIVWLHGFLGDGHEWDELAASFVHPQLFIDLPGHGGSRGMTSSGFAQTNRLLRNTLLNYNILRYWLVGYSLGGRIAMYHASRKNTGLRGLVVEGAHPGLRTKQERRERREADARWARRFSDEPLARVLDAWYRQPVFASLSATQRAALIARRRDNQPDALAGMLSATSLCRQPDLRGRLSTLTVPFHAICGVKDQRFQNVAASTQAQIHTIPAAGHNAHRENPQAFCACLHSILHSSVEENL